MARQNLNRLNPSSYEHVWDINDRAQSKLSEY